MTITQPRLQCSPTKVVDAIGCSLLHLVKHLEAQFVGDMNWLNRGMKLGMRGWEIDHIIPLSAFDLTDNAAVRKAFHWTNLQPLTFLANMAKGSSPNPNPNNFI